MYMKTRISSRQSDMLSSLAEAPAASKMQLVRRLYTGRGHAGSYDTIDRLESRGLVATADGVGIARTVTITDAGRAAIA